jgi:hypothetical protein
VLRERKRRSLLFSLTRVKPSFLGKIRQRRCGGLPRTGCQDAKKSPSHLVRGCSARETGGCGTRKGKAVSCMRPHRLIPQTGRTARHAMTNAHERDLACALPVDEERTGLVTQRTPSMTRPASRPSQDGVSFRGGSGRSRAQAVLLGENTCSSFRFHAVTVHHGSGRFCDPQRDETAPRLRVFHIVLTRQQCRWSTTS